ncbi:MAG: glycerophosphodiester phosphodiesterase family protein [Candidatus Phaeomarinobacter sp.]
MPRDLSWLTATPVAHRGLHGLTDGIVENLPQAFQAAIDNGYAIECDLQLSADGEAMVFHDATLDRLTEETGRVFRRSAADLKKVSFKSSTDRMQTLGEFLDQVSEHVVPVIELKIKTGHEGPLEERTADVLKSYKGPAAVMSFNPRSMGWFAENAPDVTRGQLSYGYRDGPALGIPANQRFALRHMLYNVTSRPHFIGFDINALPQWSVELRRRLGLPVLTWTVRSDAHRETAAQQADQIIFETFQP